MTQDELNLVLDALKWCHGGEPCGTAEAIAVVEKTLAQPEQEPHALQGLAAYLRCEAGGVFVGSPSHDALLQWAREVDAAKAQPALVQQEPVKLVSYNCKCGRTMNFESVHGVVAPQRTWVGLNKEDIESWELPNTPTVAEFAWFVEAKLKEKNFV